MSGIPDSVRAPPGPAVAWLAALVGSAEDAIIGETLEGMVLSWNPAAERLFGYPAAEAIGNPNSILADPAHPAEMADILNRLRHGETIDRFETTRRHRDGTLVPVSLTISPVRDDKGQLIGASKIARDITNRRRSEERIRLLTADLTHRTKNLLTVVAAIMRRTQAPTVADYRDTLEGRIVALDEASRLLSDADRQVATLDSLVLRIVQPFCMRDDFVMTGPRIEIGPKAAVALALALHELTTNALKYGALSHTTGRIEIACDQTADVVRVRWEERGGQVPGNPESGGQGLWLMRSCIEGQLGDGLQLDWLDSGLHCEMLIPMDQIAL
jgi:PAS domain S-box-containing protein